MSRKYSLLAKNIHASLTADDFVGYFGEYGFRVKCHIQGYSTDPNTNIIQLRNCHIYCSSKIAKECLADTAHVIRGRYLELVDPTENIRSSKRLQHILQANYRFNEIDRSSIA